MTYGLLPVSRRPKRFALLILGLLLPLSFGCGKDDSTTSETEGQKFEVSEDAKSEQATTGTPSTQGDLTSPAPPAGTANSGMTQPPSIPGSQLESLEVPDGSAEELLAFLENLDQQFRQLQRQDAPAAGSEAALRAKVGAIFEAKLAAADKILAMTETDEEIRKTAIEAKLNALMILPQINRNRPWKDEIQAFAKLLAADEDEEIARQGRTILFSLRVGDLAMDQDADFDTFMTDLEALLSEEGRGQEVIDAAQQAAYALNSIGRQEDATQAMRMTIDAFKDHSDPAIVSQANNIADRLELLELDIEAKFQAVVEGEENADQALLDAAQQSLQGSDLGPVVLQQFVRVSRSQPSSLIEMLEQTGNYELAVQIAEMVQAAFSNAGEENLKAIAMQETESTLRRLKLVGNPLVIEGTKLDGSPFDFSKYEGKIVMVDFWATWCGPCIQELPNILENYQTYHDKGFEVIGVNLDQDPQAVLDFMEEREIPWENVVGNELAQKYGVESIPFVILLDREGIVIDLHLRGDKLDEKLAELLGPPASSSSDSQPQDPETPANTPPSTPPSTPPTE